MSSYMVEDETINNIVQFLYFDRDVSAYAEHQLNLMSIDPKGDEKQLQKLGQAMFSLNAQAVNARYGERERVRDLQPLGVIQHVAEKFRPLNYRFFWPKFTNIFQTLKSLRCWIYQCSEGTIPEDPLFKIMDHLSASIAYHIVSNMPEYQAAAWK